MRRTFIILIISILWVPFIWGQDTIRYTLEQCREMALNSSISSEMQEEARLAAECTRKAALAAMFPKASANAAYMWNSKDAHLLADQAEFSFGTAGVGANGNPWFEWSSGSAVSQLAQASAGTAASTQVQGIQTQAGQAIADAYQQLYDALSIDMTHIVIGQVGITQPIYVGGRLRELYNIAKSTERIVEIQSNNKHDETIVAVDEAYWRVISVEQKKQLADYYYQLLCKLEQDVTYLTEEGMMTQSDLLKVKAKRGEAEVKKLQAENGLILSKMALAQICGLPLDYAFELDDSNLAEIHLVTKEIDATVAVEGRKELQILEEAEKIAHSNARIMAAGLQPNIVASANYIYTNPYAENGLSNDWRSHGFFSAGVVVNIPIAHADDILRYKAAKHQANLVSLKTEEAREMMTLQTTQANQKLLEAQQKVALANLNLKNAEEVLRMANESFQAGMLTASEVMQAQTAWLAAASDKVDAEVEQKVTETYLLKYTGQLR